MEQCKPDYVIVEKVERNLREFAQDPPIMQGLETDVPDSLKTSLTGQDAEENTGTGESIKVNKSDYDPDYWTITGVLEHPQESELWVCLTRNKSVRMYEPFAVTADGTDNGYLLYVPEKELASGPVEIAVVLQDGGAFRVMEKREVDILGDSEEEQTDNR